MITNKIDHGQWHVIPNYYSVYEQISLQQTYIIKQIKIVPVIFKFRPSGILDNSFENNYFAEKIHIQTKSSAVLTISYIHLRV